MSSVRKTGYIPGLDLIRLGAALFVVIYHLGFSIWAENGVSVSYRWPASIAWFGSVGVEIFFTLSGFVIAYTAVNATALSFLRSRLTRLIPGSLICATLTLLVCLAANAGAPAHLAAEWGRSAFLPLHTPFIDGSYWTLPIEIVFYGVVLMLVALQRERLLPRVLGFVGLASSTVWITLSIAVAIRPQQALPGGLLPLEVIYRLSMNQRLALTLLPHGCFFAIGVLLWFCLTHRFTVAKVAVLCVCLIGGLSQIFWHATFELVFVPWALPNAPRWTWHPAVPCVVWLCSVMMIVWFVKENDRLAALLGPLLPAIRWAGLLTYPLYLLHQRVGFILIEVLKGWLGDNGSLAFVIAAMIGAALLIAKFGEPPLRRWGQQRLGG
jgi:peptidoglycan/LPS O-acetylase OafA/YrhL